MYGTSKDDRTKWEFLHHMEYEIELALEAFKNINTNQENNLEQIEDKLKKQIKEDKNLQSLELEYQDSYFFHIYERDIQVIEQLKQHQRYGQILVVFSFLEGRLKIICNEIEEEFKFKIKIDDLNNSNDLMRYWNYLEKVYELDPVKVEPSFTPLNQRKIIRNIIAHQEGICQKGQQLSKLKSVQGNGFLIKARQIIIQKNDFINYLLTKIELFFKELLKAIDERYKEINPNTR